ncbi:MAG: type II secretion system F family protein [Candidatus Cloacimonetes bacterium]|nr:type II secretion system F family protein [Candidatus Cloacimonadota bacterium]
MAGFHYIIKDTKGSRVEGAIKATTMEEAIEKLARDGNVIISVKAASDDDKYKGEMSLVDKFLLAIHKIRTSVRLKILVFFTRQLATMFSAGLTLEKSITNLASSEKSKKFKKILEKVSTDIKKGFSLSEALEEHPGVFNPLYIALVKAGEVSGTLHTVLDELAEYLEKIEDTRMKVATAFVYPIIVIVFTVLVIFGLFYFIIPMFANVYADYGADLPGPTLIAIAISNFIRGHIFFTLLIIVGSLFSIFIFYLTDRGRYIIDKILLSLPIMGNMLKNSIFSKYARTFSILMASGVPIMETLDLVKGVVQNGVISKAISKATKLIKEGYSINGAFKKTNAFPSTLVQLLETGEETGEIDKLLAKGAQFHQKIVDTIVERLTALIQPLLIMVIAVLVGGIIIVIYLPVFKLGLAMQRGLK